MQPFEENQLPLGPERAHFLRQPKRPALLAHTH